ncbi:MAG TPA: hypothetical protein PLY87_01185 [Planctomycetaceae bacterium]|nr:hypothetical protein [Planctomycetaceae bacterium]HQZ63650.1 hypothetical protein [Planctomycetaceae bacterium]
MFRKQFTPFRIRAQTASPLLTAGFIVVTAGCEERPNPKLPNEVPDQTTAPASMADKSALSDGSADAIQFRSVIFGYPGQDKP